MVDVISGLHVSCLALLRSQCSRVSQHLASTEHCGTQWQIVISVDTTGSILSHAAAAVDEDEDNDDDNDCMAVFLTNIRCLSALFAADRTQ